MAELDSPKGKSSHWSVTINNYTSDDMIAWNNLKNFDFVKKVMGQVEEGENGTPHIQGCVKTTYGRFFKKLKAHLPRAHIEPARNPSALEKYVQKSETRVASIPTIKTASQSDVQEGLYSLLIYNGNYHIPEWNHKDEFEANFHRCRRYIKDNWERLIDLVVSELICQGFYGVEFVMANNQVRTAFKKYIDAIIWRTHMSNKSKL